MWTYSQGTGALIDPAGAVAGECYSGHGEGVNNPDMQEVHDIGPIPRGLWQIGRAVNSPHTGPLSLPLTWLHDPAQPGGVPGGRFGFYMHGDTPAMNRTASNGCVIAARALREIIDASPIKLLRVVS